MREQSLTRRQILKVGALGTASLAAGGIVLSLPGLAQGDAKTGKGQASHHEMMTVGQLATGLLVPV